jgi:hypothetical protein
MTPRSLTPLSGDIVTGTVSPWPAYFAEPMYPAGHYAGAPRDRETTSTPGSCGPGISRQTSLVPSADTAAPRPTHPCRPSRLGGAP